MTKYLRLSQIIIFLFILLLVQSEQVFSQIITIYHNNFAVVQKNYNFSLEEGISWKWIRNLPETLDINSIFLYSSGSPRKSEIRAQKVLRSSEHQITLLSNYEGKNIEIIIKNDSNLEGKLKSIQPSTIVIEDNTGRIHLINRSSIIRMILPFEPSQAESSYSAGWMFESKSAGKYNFELLYFLSGLSWKANYIGIFDEENELIRLQTRAGILNETNTSFSIENLRLIAGDVNKPNIVRRPMQAVLRKGVESMSEGFADEMEYNELYEYHLYQITGPEIIEPHSLIFKKLVKDRQVSVTKKYIFDGIRTGKKINIQLSFINKSDSGPGIPMPKGTINLYQIEKNNTLTFLNEDVVPPTADNKELKISGGVSFDLTGERTRTTYNKISRTTVEESFKVLLYNASTEDRIINVIEHLRNDWTITKNSHPYSSIDSHSIEFSVPVSKKSNTTLTYIVKHKN